MHFQNIISQKYSLALFGEFCCSETTWCEWRLCKTLDFTPIVIKVFKKRFRCLHNLYVTLVSPVELPNLVTDINPELVLDKRRRVALTTNRLCLWSFEKGWMFNPDQKVNDMRDETKEGTSNYGKGEWLHSVKKWYKKQLNCVFLFHDYE